MALPELKAQLKTLVRSMFEEGILDHQFSQLQELQDESSPNFVAEIITLFCNNTQKVITELDKYLCQEDVDFSKLGPYVHQLKGSSCSIGAKQMKLACGNLRQASDDKNKQGFLQALTRITHEYVQLEYKFQTLMQLEKKIYDIETSQQLQDGKYAAWSPKDT